MCQVMMTVFYYLVPLHLHLTRFMPHTRLNYLPPKSRLITSSADNPKKTKCQLTIHISKIEYTASNQPGTVPKLIRSKEQILQAYSEVFDRIGCFPGPPYHKHVNPSITPKQTPCRLMPVISKSHSSKKLTRYCKLVY